MTWTGRQLSTLTKNGSTFSYKYDVDGLRLEKTANGVTTEYQYVNGQLLGEKRSNGVILRYTYDPFGALSSIRYTNGGGTWHNYIVRCTLSGDVDQIFNTSGNLVARYIYDTWGNTVSVTDASGNAITSTTHIANINPIRYRGYYWDKETGLYYLQSRYYDTETKRFLNADEFLVLEGNDYYRNIFYYCNNNPVNAIDIQGAATVTLSTGRSYILAFLGVSETISLSFDGHGNIAIQNTHAYTDFSGESGTAIMGLFSAGATTSITITSLDSVDDLNGISTSIGFSSGTFALDIISNGYRAVDNDTKLNGIQIGYGAGIGIDVHTVQAHTTTIYRSTFSALFKKKKSLSINKAKKITRKIAQPTHRTICKRVS